jgi:hypothetical protein
VEAGKTYGYWLEDVGVSGGTTRHGPVRVTVAAPTAVTVRDLAAAAQTGAGWFVLGLAAVLGAAFILRRR